MINIILLVLGIVLVIVSTTLKLCKSKLKSYKKIEIFTDVILDALVML